MPTIQVDGFDAQEWNDQIKAELLKSLQIHHGTEDGRVFLSAMSRAAEAYQGDLGSFWRNVCVNLVNSVSAGRNIPEFIEGAQVVKRVLESSLLLTACINNTSVLGKDVLNVAVDFVREDVVCGRCGHKGHFHSTCFKPLSGSVGGGKGGRGKGPGHGVEFPTQAPAPYTGCAFRKRCTTSRRKLFTFVMRNSICRIEVSNKHIYWD